jgi:Reverse transcriptase (RNA-dependent DNA polymerase)
MMERLKGIRLDWLSKDLIKLTVLTTKKHSTNLGWVLFQMDVKNTFLQGILDEEVYMVPPPGYNNLSNSSLVCKLKKGNL